MNIVTATFLSLLPKRYRAVFTQYEIPGAGAVISGLLQTLICLGLLFRGYYAFVDMCMAQMPTDLLIRVAEKGGEPAIAAFGPMFMTEYLFRVTTFLLLFWVIEGVIRTIAAIGAKETLPDLLLFLVAMLHTKIDAENHERSMGARIRDDVQLDPSGERLQISSCRPKQWTNLTTISHEDELYELVREEKASAPRPFVYHLRKKPPTAVIRGIYAYDPNEALPGKVGVH